MERIILIEHKEGMLLHLDSVLGMFKNSGNAVGFYNRETRQVKYYLIGKRSFIIGVWSALKNNGYEVSYGVE